MFDDASTALDSPLWRFALTLYERPGVPQATLILQDGDGIDVAFVLASLWLAQRGVDPVVAAVSLRRAHARTEALRASVLAPVRAARRAFKPLIESLPDVLQEPSRALRKRLAGEELALERLTMRCIYEELRELPEGGGRVTDARACLTHYLDAASLRLSEQSEAAFASLTKSAG